MVLINTTAQDCWITTMDNPYDPFTNFDEWYAFDTMHGYNTCGYLARIARTSDELSEEDYNIEVENAINKIIYIDPINIYIKVINQKTKTTQAV